MDFLRPLRYILQEQEHSLHFYLLKFLRKQRYTDIIDKPYQYIVAKGTDPYVLIAHLDTMRKYPINKLHYSTVLHTLSTTGILGADDRAGVCIILELLKMGHHPTVIFTHGEETGGIGAHALAHDYPKPLFNANYLIEIDRRGKNEVVFYNNHTPEMCALFTKYGFEVNIGTFSDVCILSSAWRIMGANVSAGYYNEHTPFEYVNLDDMQSTIDKLDKFMRMNYELIPYSERGNFI